MFNHVERDPSFFGMTRFAFALTDQHVLPPGYDDADEFAFDLDLSLDGLQRVGIRPGVGSWLRHAACAFVDPGVGWQRSTHIVEFSPLVALPPWQGSSGTVHEGNPCGDACS